MITVQKYLKVKISRNPIITKFPFKKFFQGFEKVDVVREIFGEKTEEVLENLEIEFFSRRRGYMGVSEQDGHIIISADYLRNGNIEDIYLDIIHELVHVKQFLEGKELFDNNYKYIERPTEIEAFKYAVKEARKIGLNNEKICDYLKTEWMSEEDIINLAKKLNVKRN